MTYSEFVQQIGKEVSGFMTKFNYNGSESKEAFWIKVNQGITSWQNKYNNTDYSWHATKIISGVFEAIEFETGTKESP